MKGYPYCFFLYCAVFVSILCLIGSHLASQGSISATQSRFLKEVGDTILLVTAHPDDESVFFTPAIQFLHLHGKNVSLLTLTAGEFCNGLPDYHLALQRLKELKNSCTVLHV